MPDGIEEEHRRRLRPARSGGRPGGRPRARRTRGSHQPPRVALVFGPGVDPARRARDRAATEALIDRLAPLTGLPMRLTGRRANVHVLIAGAEARGDRAWLDRAVPDMPDRVAREIVSMPRDTFCSAFSISSPEAPSVFSRAIVVIRDEHPDLLRRSCLHEEIAQALGLSNDSPRARPSIFNDDEEFALLTAHDEMLLRMLYDPALEPGMDIDTARPIIGPLAESVLASTPEES